MRKSLLLSSSFVILFACGGGGDKKGAVSADNGNAAAPEVPADATDVPSEWRGESYKAEACSGDEGSITLTSTALTYYDSCYSSSPTSITGIKVKAGDGKLDSSISTC